MKKIVILGSTGMLGNTVAKIFLKSKDKEVFTSYRNKKFSQKENSFYFDALTSNLDDIPKCDYIINCIGVIKPFMKTNIASSIEINSLFPHKLSTFCKENKIKLIHITTDCVFSGKLGNYDENSLHDCEDEYGKSKSLGEPKDCMVIRTSIIGEEIHKNASLIEWVKSNKGGSVNGFTNHMWNGITTKHYGELCNKIIDEELYKAELFHIHSNEISKFELLNLINDRFSLNIKINAVQSSYVNRTLASNKNLLKTLKVKTIQQQIGEL
jgi:dTDP-4-dehydrorhamnose reductase